MNKYYIAAIATLGITATAIGTGAAYAQTIDTNPMTGLAKTIAQKFNLDQTQVQNVVTEYHTQQREKMQIEMQKRLEDRLNEDVSKGNITESQKHAILKKMKEMRNTFGPEKFKDKTMEQMKAEKEKMHAELRSWATANGIDESYLRFGFEKGMNNMRGMFKDNMMKNN